MLIKKTSQIMKQLKHKHRQLSLIDLITHIIIEDTIERSYNLLERKR
jgi:hypothetical protein